MFQNQFHLTKRGKTGLQRIFIFTVNVYAKMWIDASNPAAGPWNDIDLLNLKSVWEIDAKVGNVVLNKLLQHLWYLSEELIALSLFNAKVSKKLKRKIVTSIIDGAGGSGEPESPPPKKITIPKTSISHCQLQDFTTRQTVAFF